METKFDAFMAGLFVGVIVCFIALTITISAVDCNYQLWFDGDNFKTDARAVNMLIESEVDSLVVRNTSRAYPIGIIKFHKTGE